MRILLITDNHTPTGGAENYFFDLKDRLKKVPGIETFSMGFGPINIYGNDFYVLKGLKSKISRLVWQVIIHPIVYFKLRRQISEFKPDVIHIHNIKQYTASILKAIKPYPVVQTIHDYGVICPVAQNIHKDNLPCPTGMRLTCFWKHRVKYNPLVYLALAGSFYQKRNQLKKTVKKFLAPSPLLAEYLNKNHFQHSIHLAPFIKEQTTYSFDRMKPGHFLFAGNLGRHKGVHILIEEFALACKKSNTLFLTIAGAGPEALRLEQQVQNLGIEKNVTFIGWHPHLDEHYDKNTAVIFPSIGFESFGLVITEAMSHARAVIGINWGTSAWIIDDNQTGLLFDPLKKGDLAEKILNLANDTELAKKLGIKGFEKLQTFIDNDAILRQLIDIYKECCR